MSDIAAEEAPPRSSRWDANASFWVQIIREHRDKYRNELTDPAMLQAIGDPRHLDVLDAGCGEGYLSRILARQDATVTGIDFSPKLIEAARQHNHLDELTVSFDVGSVDDLPYEADTFDLVTCNHVMNDLRDPTRSISEFARVLRQGGRLVILMLHPCFYNRHAERDDTTNGVLAASYFDVRRIEQNFEVDGLTSPVAKHRLVPLPRVLHTAALQDRICHYEPPRATPITTPDEHRQLLAAWFHSAAVHAHNLRTAPMITPPPHDSIKGESHPPEPLSRLERVAALFVGTITAAVGGYAVFETSNQAGTVMLLIVAIVFLLIGIQGTPLIRFTSSSASVELEQRKRTEVRQAIEQASEEYGAEKAEGIFEGVSLVAPNLLPESFSRYEEYENKLARELSKMDYTVSRVDQVAGFRPDFAVQQNGITVYVEVRHYASRIYTDMVNQAIGMAVILSTPVLLVASSELTPHARKVLANTDKVQFVTWQDEKDNPQLREALNHLLGSVEDL